ncbi:MAG: alpha/beta hydrolase [Candidatus Micrarchaeota archaeon]
MVENAKPAENARTAGNVKTAETGKSAASADSENTTSPFQKHSKIFLLLIALLLIAFLIYYFARPPSKFYVDPEGRGHYPAERGLMRFTEELISQDADYNIFKVLFDSNGTDVFGKLWLPKGSKDSAAILLLPGGSVPKEAGSTYADVFRAGGIAIFALDQRGIGESKAQPPGSMQEEYGLFASGRETISILMAYDALKAFDYLRQRDDIDDSKIIIIGESMGGRNAIIAGAMDNRFKLVVGISTGGYGKPEATDNEQVTKFLRSFDPDNYISQISPRKVALFHSTEDTVQPYSIGYKTYGFAKEPKVFYQVSCKTHGLCDEMMPKLEEEVADAIK